MEERFDSKAPDLIVQLSPCIRPPHYEVDFAAEIVRQCRDAGVENVNDCNICTACDLQHYYSYRAEKGPHRPNARVARAQLNFQVGMALRLQALVRFEFRPDVRRNVPT